MRICLVAHGFPPVERTGVENYTQGLCRALAQAGHRVEVFVPRRDPLLADLALRREERGGFAVNWITNNHEPGTPREALMVPELKGAFAAFLERERPEVVHFQHLIKLGLELVSVARERGLPTVYTAHDYYPICHRYTLLRPDLSRCDARGDSLACARCDLALAHLNAQPALGDYHAGVLASQVSAEAWSTLQGILADRLEEHGLARETLRVACEQRTELDQLRREAYRGFDLVLAPSRFLIGELVRGGFERERIEHEPYGFDNADLVGLAPVRRDPERAVRFAFLGGLAKHKGVHVLLDAFARLRGGAELAVWGGSSDRVYVDLVRKRCGEVGAQWRGPYERADLPRILGGVDALVVPSMWVENYPLVIHEGFSAGRPVLASGLGALGESVQDGVDGLLFAPGDAEDLARVLQRCVDEPGLLTTLARGIGPVKTMEEEARGLVARYEGLLRARSAARPSEELPPSLRGPLARFEALSTLPARELFVRALSGLDDLREAWTGELGEVEAVELLAIGLGEGSEAQDRLREARNEIAWLRTQKEQMVEGREELMKLFEDLDQVLNETRVGSKRQADHLESAGVYVRQKEAEVLEAQARLVELEQAIAEKNRHIAERDRYIAEKDRDIGEKDRYIAEKDRDIGERDRYIAEKDQDIGERDRHIGERDRHIAEKDRHIGEVEGTLQEAGRYIRHKEQEFSDVEAEWRKADEYARSKEAELEQAQERLRAAERGQRELERGARAAADVGLTALEAQEHLLASFLRPVLVLLHRVLRPGGEPELPNERAHFAELVGALRQVLDGLETIGGELEWRRGLMADAHRAADRPLIRRLLGRTRLVRMVRAWEDGRAAGEGAER